MFQGLLCSWSSWLFKKTFRVLYRMFIRFISKDFDACGCIRSVLAYILFIIDDHQKHHSCVFENSLFSNWEKQIILPSNTFIEVPSLYVHSCFGWQHYNIQHHTEWELYFQGLGNMIRLVWRTQWVIFTRDWAL